MKANILTVILLLLLSAPLFAQSNKLEVKPLSKHSISFEALIQPLINGNLNGATSVNYEYTFLPKWRARMGVGSSFHNDNLFIPMGIHYLTGQKAHHLDLSAGGYLLASWYRSGHEGRSVDTYIYPYVGAGYRYQKEGQAFFFKAQPVMLIPVPTPLLTLSVGWTF